jgi:hypothetical protein
MAALYPEGVPPDERSIYSFGPIGKIRAFSSGIANAPQGTWTVVLSEEDLGDGVEFSNIGMSVIPVVLAYVSKDDPSDNSGWLVDDTTPVAHFWLGAPSNNPETPWGNYAAGVEPIVAFWVEYSCPPFWLVDTSTILNTLATSGVRTATCIFQYYEGSVDELNFLLQWKVGINGAINHVAATISDAMSTGSADIEYSATVGDTLFYWWDVTDDIGGHFESPPSNFQIKPGPTDENILLIKFGLDEDVADVSDRFWNDYSDYGVFVWDVDENDGYEEALFDYAWDAVIINGVNTSVPLFGYADWPGAGYLENGGNIMVMDVNYVWNHTHGDDDALVDLAPGDFGFDVLGVGQLITNPTVLDGIYYSPDAADPITGAWEVNPFISSPKSVMDYWYDEDLYHSDYITNIGEATSIFVDENGCIYASRYERADGGRSVYVSFDICTASELTADAGDTTASGQPVGLTDDGIAFMKNIMTYFGATELSVPRMDDALPTGYTLSRNYPNPFNPSTRISFTVPTEGRVMVKVYNINGREVATLFNGNVAAGTKTLTFDASTLASGVYLYRMEAGDFVQARKMILVK